MRITAKVHSALHEHEVAVETDGVPRPVAIAARETGTGSSVNGGELLFLALATCFCNNLYREAAAVGIHVDAVDVTVTGSFGGRGEPACDVRYEATVTSPDAEADVEALMRLTDTVAEIQNTMRGGVEVSLATTRVVRPGEATG
jgi:organic hydroperoxide reductase OsmC/OhrA